MKSRVNKNWTETVLMISGLGISLAMMASCGGSNAQPHQLTAIAVSPTGAGANVGDTVPFSATGTFAQAPTTQTNISAQWTSSDVATATIDLATGAATCVGIGAGVTITASASGMAGPVQSTATLTCAAVGSGPVKFVPNSLIFSCQYIAVTNSCSCSLPAHVTVTNSLSTSLTLDSISASGMWFSESSSCGTSIGPGQSCGITVSWSPMGMTGPGGDGGSVTISDSDGTSPQTVGLTGFAHQCAP